MDNYQLLVDAYEAETIKEDELTANNVAGVIIRLNHIGDRHHLDENFTAQWAETGTAGLLRIPFFIYSPWVDGQANYEWLVKHMPYEAGAVMVGIVVADHDYSPDIYAAEVARFCELVSSRWNFMIYTGEGYLDMLNTWPTKVDYWWAQYPFSLYPNTPEHWTWGQVRGRIDVLPGPTNLDKVPGVCWMWQATGERLIVPGCDKPIAVDVFPGTLDELKAWVNEKDHGNPDFVEEQTQPFEGVELHKVYRYNSHCFVAVINPTDKRFLVTKFAHKAVSTVAREEGAQLVINGGGYGSYGAVGLHASLGEVYHPVDGYEPWINLTEDNQPQINAFNSKEKVYNALAGKRFIVQDGRISPNTSVAWREVHPRTLVGITQDGNLIECVVDGRQGPHNIGINLFDAARIMIEFGAWKAIDLDGGGSTTMWVNDRVVNSPIDDGVPGRERLVGTHIVMFADGGTPTPLKRNYIVVKPVKPRLTPSMYEENTNPNLPVDTVFQSKTTRVVSEKIPAENGTEYTIIWVQMPDGYWVPKFYKVEYLKDTQG